MKPNLGPVAAIVADLLPSLALAVAAQEADRAAPAEVTGTGFAGSMSPGTSPAPTSAVWHLRRGELPGQLRRSSARRRHGPYPPLWSRRRGPTGGRVTATTSRWVSRSLGHFRIGKTLLSMETAIVETNAADANVRDAASGDELALARLIDEHHEPMVRAAFVVIGDVQLAHEAAQDAWAIAWRRLASLRDPEKVRPWLVAICANEARRLARRRQRQRVIEIASEPPGPGLADPAGAIDVLDLERALARLKPEERGLLAMRYVVGLDSQDIARAVGLSASGVRSRLARLVERLRRDLDDA